LVSVREKRRKKEKECTLEISEVLFFFRLSFIEIPSNILSH